MNTHDETAEDAVSSLVNGYDELVLADDGISVRVTVGSADRWDRSHLRRLRQSADLPGLVPVIDSDFASDGTPFAVTPVIDEPALASMIPPEGPAWQDGAGITEAAARATHEAHLRGLFHGALSPDQIFVVGDDVAVAGVGLGLGGAAHADYHHWVAPEVLDGVDATERSDVYSLGKILEAALGDSLEDVPRSVRRLIMWSGSDTPEARPPSALEFASILAEALGEDRRTYSPAFIPTADANTLAATASGVVSAHRPAAESGASVGVAAAGAAAVAGVAAVAATDDEADVEVVEAVAADDTEAAADDEPIEAAEVTAEAEPTEEADIDDEAEEAVLEGEEVVEEAEELEAPVDDTEDIMDSGVGVIDADDEVDEEAVDEGTVDDAAEVDETADDGADVVDEAATDDDEILREAVITDEVDVDEDALGAAAAASVEIKADEAADFDSREFSGAIGDAAIDDVEVPAAQTLDFEPAFDEEQRSNRAGILVGVILAAGLALIAFQLLRSDDGVAVDESADDAGDQEGTESEVAAPSTEPDSEPATAQTGDGTETTELQTTTTTEQTTTSATDPPEEAPEAAVAQAPVINGPVSIDEAGLQIVHGIPGADVDLYVDGEAIIPGFSAGTIAGPVELSAGSHIVDLYPAMDNPPAQSGDRTDSPIMSESVSTGTDPASLFAHLDANGRPALSGFNEELAAAAPGEGRIVVRHLAQAPAVNLVVDGEPVAGDGIANGQSATVAISAGEHTVAAVTGDGTPVAEAVLSLDDGEMAAITVFGAADSGNLDAVVQRFVGLSSAPASVPTGNSNLLGEDEDLTSLYLVGLLTIAMVVAGGVLMIRRRQIL